MYGLSKKQKVKIVLEKVKNLEISTYEIGKKTGLSVSGLDKLFSGSVKNPHENTLNKILEFLENKVLVTYKDDDYTQNILNEPEEEYQIASKKLEPNSEKDLNECYKKQIKLFEHVNYLQTILRKKNIEYEELEE